MHQLRYGTCTSRCFRRPVSGGNTDSLELPRQLRRLRPPTCLCPIRSRFAVVACCSDSTNTRVRICPRACVWVRRDVCGNCAQNWQSLHFSSCSHSPFRLPYGPSARKCVVYDAEQSPVPTASRCSNHRTSTSLWCTLLGRTQSAEAIGLVTFATLNLKLKLVSAITTSISLAHHPASLQFPLVPRAHVFLYLTRTHWHCRSRVVENPQIVVPRSMSVSSRVSSKIAPQLTVCTAATAAAFFATCAHVAVCCAGGGNTAATWCLTRLLLSLLSRVPGFL